MDTSAQEHKQLITEVIQKEMVILGPDITLATVKQVDGLSVSEDGTVTDIQGNHQQILQHVIDEFVKLSGEIVKQTMAPLLAQHQQPATEPEQPAEEQKIVLPAAPIQPPLQTQDKAPEEQPAQPTAEPEQPAPQETTPTVSEPAATEQTTPEPAHTVDPTPQETPAPTANPVPTQPETPTPTTQPADPFATPAPAPIAEPTPQQQTQPTEPAAVPAPTEQPAQPEAPAAPAANEPAPAQQGQTEPDMQHIINEALKQTQ